MHDTATTATILTPADLTTPSIQPDSLRHGETARNGTRRLIDGKERVFYDGYWMKTYDVPHTIAYKKWLIDQLTRRVFRNTEPGINTPGKRLEEVKAAYNSTSEPSRKRVLAAMLAGAYLNRGSDILTKVVELEEIGITVESSNELLRECGRCFMNALEFGKNIHPLHGTEELDELWGEPFKAFTMPIPQFLETRYIKLAKALSDIDLIANTMIDLVQRIEYFPGVAEQLKELRESAKEAAQTQRSDIEIIEIWPRFVGVADRLHDYRPVVPPRTSRRVQSMAWRGKQIIKIGADLIGDISSLRISKPKTTQSFLQRCEHYRQRYLTNPQSRTISADDLRA
jgi:hypothetical protein